MAQVGIPLAAHGLSSSVQQQTKERRCLHSTRKEGEPKEKCERENRRQEELFSFFFFPFPFFILPVLCLFLSKPLEIVTDRSSVFQFLCQGVLLIL